VHANDRSAATLSPVPTRALLQKVPRHRHLRLRTALYALERRGLNAQAGEQPPSASSSSSSFDFALRRPAAKLLMQSAPHRLRAHHFLSGYGAEFGGAGLRLFNPSYEASLLVDAFESIPRYVVPYMHSLRVSVNGSAVPSDSAFERLLLTPSPGGRASASAPDSLELRVRVRPRTAVEIHYQFEKAFLDWTAFPPDANLGYELGPFSLSACVLANESELAGAGELGDRCAGERHLLHTEMLSIGMATPDFSMPYNVICLSGTVFALFFGSIFNGVMRRLRHIREGKPDVSEKPIARLIRFVLSKFEKKKAA
jgi:GPI-anchor transamidase subunit T